MPRRPFQKKIYMLGDFQAALFMRNREVFSAPLAWQTAENLRLPAKWGLRNEHRNPYWCHVHYPNMGSATDWLKQISLATRPRTENATSQWNQWWRCHENSGVFLRLGYHGQIWAVVALNSFLYLRNLFGHTLCAWQLMAVALQHHCPLFCVTWWTLWFSQQCLAMHPSSV